jgi:hypothetical protein
MSSSQVVCAVSHVFFGMLYGLSLLLVPDRVNGTQKGGKLDFKERYLVYMSMSTISSVLEGMIGLFTLASCVLYIAETYDDKASDQADCTNTPFFLAEVVFSTGFTFHFFLHWYLAPFKFVYLLSLQTLVDVVTILPVYFAVFVKIACGSGLSNSFKFVRVVRLLRMLRSLTMLASGWKNPIVFQLVVTVATMTVTLVFAAGIVHFLQTVTEENWSSSRGPLTFIDALYFTVTTISTVGYGDFSPITDFGRGVTICLILFAIVIIQMEASKLSFLMGMQNSFRKAYIPQGAFTHIIIACDVTCRGLETFLHEIYHDDHLPHGSKLLKVCAPLVLPTTSFLYRLQSFPHSLSSPPPPGLSVPHS